MMANDMNIGVNISADTRQFNAGMKNVQGGLTQSGASMSKFAAGGVAAMAAIGVAAAAAGAAVFASFIKKSTGVFIDFEASLTKTAAIMGKTSKDELPEIEAEIKALGRETKSTALEVAEAAQILALAGFDKIDMVDEGSLRNLNNLAIAAGVSIPEASAVAVSSLKGFGLEVGEMKRVNDVLLNTMTSTFTEIHGLGEAMKFAAPTAAAMGISIEETAAAIGKLGDAGLQGSMAGTAVRMALTKLLKPTDDARKLMEDLNLDFFTLTPAGQAAKTALRDVGQQLEASKASLMATNAQMKALNEEMSDLSIEQQSNNLAIMKIRRRAEKEGRELTQREIDQIERLEGMNADLNITMAERRIEQQQLTAEQKKQSEAVSAQQKEFTDLNKTVSQQTTGLTSLSDVFQQLSAAGATTNQMLELFGVRGGTAANILLSNVDGMDELTRSNIAAQEGIGKTAEMVGTMSTTTLFATQSLSAEWEGFMLMVGEEFGPVLRDAVIPALKDMIVALEPSIPAFAEMAVALADIIPRLAESFIPLLGQAIVFLDTIAPILRLVAYAMEFLFYFMEPVYRMFAGIAQVIVSIIELDFDGVIDGLTQAFGAWFEVINPVWRVLKSIAQMLGFDLGGFAEDIESSTGFNVGSAAAGAGIGMMFGGPVGAAIGGAIGGFFFAEGGIVDEPVYGVVGEAGPEAVIPIEKIDGIIASSMQKAGNGIGSNTTHTVHIQGGIHIGAGNNVNKAEVKEALDKAFIDVINGAKSGRNARGVI
jgi:TP901 family phage tail tape measure protein